LQIAQRFGLTVVATQPIAMLGRTIYTFSIGNGRTVRQVIRLIEAAHLRVAVQPNYIFILLQEPTAGQPSQPAGTSPEPPVNLGDPAQYIVQKFQLGEAQRIAKGDNVVIAVIDSEIDAMHPDLAGVVTSRYDAGCGASAPDAHGTGMTGAIASHAHLLGVAPNAKVIAICAFGGAAAQATSSSVNIINGLGYATAQGARIVNMSFAGPYDKALAQALQVAREKGVLLIGAAGNAGPKSPPLYPGADPNVMAVTATDPDDHLFNGANQGKYITVAAPGVDVLVPSPNEGVQLTTGTSVATAEVSGVAALLIAQRPSRTPMEIRTTLTSTAKHLGAKGVNPQFGAGLVDPLKALRLPPVPVSRVPKGSPGPAPAAPGPPPTIPGRSRGGWGTGRLEHCRLHRPAIGSPAWATHARGWTRKCGCTRAPRPSRHPSLRRKGRPWLQGSGQHQAACSPA
jgi:subtilisin family serine protease